MMKKVFFLALLIVGISSCAKQRDIATVQKDCTGTYIRINNKDWQVCNSSMLQVINSGQTVQVTFTKVDECNAGELPEVVCELYHPSEGFVRLYSVK